MARNPTEPRTRYSWLDHPEYHPDYRPCCSTGGCQCRRLLQKCMAGGTLLLAESLLCCHKSLRHGSPSPDSNTPMKNAPSQRQDRLKLADAAAMHMRCWDAALLVLQHV
jgi:hypothetical protein